MKWFKSFWKARRTPPPPERREFDGMLMNFTPRAQQVLGFAHKEAVRFRHNFVGTEHLLLGLIRLGQGTAVTVLGKMGADLEKVRLEVEKQVGTGTGQNCVGPLMYTPRVKKVLALAAKEAKALNHTYVGTEHILLGLLREGDGVAGRVLKGIGVDTEVTRQNVLKELDPNYSPTPDGAATPQKPESEKSQRETVDTSRRYDVYCREGDQQVIYRNALFKGVRMLFQKRDSDYIELEQADGRTIFLARSTLIKFCEHDTTAGSEGV